MTYYEKHREERLAYQKKYNKDRGINGNSRMKALRLTDPDRASLLTRLKRFKRKALKSKTQCIGSINVETLQSLLDKFSHCPYCGTVLLQKNTTFDHKIPLSLGGHHSLENLIPCCHKCNSRKGAMPYESWLKVMPIVN